MYLFLDSLQAFHVIVFRFDTYALKQLVHDSEYTVLKYNPNLFSLKMIPICRGANNLCILSVESKENQRE